MAEGKNGRNDASVGALLNAALQHHQAGRLAAAEPLYRQALAIEPNNPDGLNLLGVLAHQVGRNDVAVDLIGRAIRLDAGQPDFHHNLGAVFLALGRHEDMARCYRAAIALQPDYAEAHFNLGVACQALGRLDEAAVAYRAVVGLQPNHPLAHARLGAVLKDQGRLQEAEAALRCAVALHPNAAEAHNNLGVVLEALDRLEDAKSCYRRAIDLKPDFPAAHYNLGGALRASQRLDEAESAYRRAIALKPEYTEAYNNLGAVLQAQERLEDARASFSRAIALNPHYAEAHNNLGGALKALDHLDEAVSAFTRAVELNPDYAEAHHNLGVVLTRAERPEAGAQAHRRAVQLTPDNAQAHCSLGVALQLAGRVQEATAAFDRAMQLKPDFSDADSARLFGLLYTDIGEEALFAEHRRWDERHGGGPRAPDQAFSNTRDPDRRLRIGYVSADFNFHPVGVYLTRVVAAQDRFAFEIFCYYNGKIEDDFTGLLRAKADHWRSLAGISNDDAEAMIRRDGIDILIDLSGHTGGNRLPLFARRPVPVQASWLGYPGTTGLSAIDYLVMDAAAVPYGLERYCSEAVVRLPHSRFCYTPPSYAPDTLDPAVRDSAPITFGCFNNLAKITPEVIRLWAQVLHATPGSRLVLKWKALHEAPVRRRLGEAFAEQGIAADRLEFRGVSPHVQMLAEYGGIDIALDPFPFCGGLTSCEALWMGVPVVTLPGDRPVSRQTLGFLNTIGLSELAAESQVQYVEIATALAADPQRRADLRRTLRARMAASPLCDPGRFAQALDFALRRMWRRWCAGEPAITFDVPDL